MQSDRKSTVRRRVLGLTAAAVLTLPLAACSGGDDSDASVSNTPKPVATVNDVDGQSTSVTLDAGFVEALTSLKLTPGTVGDATLTQTAVSFPITGGDVMYYKPGSVSPYVQGLLEHDGSGLSLTSGSTKVELMNLEVDPAKSRVYGDVSVNGEQAAEHATIFNLDGRTLKPLQTQGSTAILEGTKVTVSADAAALLDKTFKTEAVKQGLPVGVAKITINTA